MILHLGKILAFEYLSADAVNQQLRAILIERGKPLVAVCACIIL